MEHIKLNQCYNCFEFLHLRPQCTQTKLCSRCGLNHEHSYIECEAPYSCPNCFGPHPATARICPHYIQALANHEKVIYEQLRIKFSQQNIPNDNAIGTDLLRAAALSSSNNSEFINNLFKACSFSFQNPDSILSNETVNPLDQSYSELPSIEN